MSTSPNRSHKLILQYDRSNSVFIDNKKLAK